MVATTAEKNYFHLVSVQLDARFDNVISLVFHASAWETQSHDPLEVLSNRIMKQLS